MALTDAQKRAKEKYEKKVQEDKELREHRNYMNARRGAKNFIKNRATEDDLSMLQECIDKRKQELEK